MQHLIISILHIGRIISDNHDTIEDESLDHALVSCHCMQTVESLKLETEKNPTQIIAAHIQTIETLCQIPMIEN